MNNKKTLPSSQKVSAESDESIIAEIQRLLDSYDPRYEHNALIRIYSLLHDYLPEKEKR